MSMIKLESEVAPELPYLKFEYLYCDQGFHNWGDYALLPEAGNNQVRICKKCKRAQTSLLKRYDFLESKGV